MPPRSPSTRDAEPRDASVNVATPRRIGSWELVSPLGAGGMCDVFLARSVAEECRSAPAYAVKVLKPEWTETPAAIEIMRREAMVGARVRSANVAPVLASSCAAAPYFLVTPRLVGRTLRDALACGWRPELPIALWIARQIVNGLIAIETTCGMIHGDVSPSNIFLSPSGHATLIDLGAARTARERRAAVDRPVQGALLYAAPETLTSALAADARSDLYSLGATLYEMLSGAPLFKASDAAEMVRLHREEKPNCIRERRPNVPKPIASLVHTMLCKDPLRRPTSLVDALDRIARLEIEWFADRAA